ncbi:MAG: crotonase/enoyl-CoA hydratase family protein [Desulfobacteraceae bacterium]|nr:MAG: crotonase/enoyl-CoA hydratase family protein [Desulfobacteraceae bacterium]
MDKKEPFRIKQDGHIVWMTLNRPEKRNTMDSAFFVGLAGYFEKFDKDPDIRAIIISAEGKSFTAGLDLMEAGDLLGDGSAGAREVTRRKILELQDSMNIIERCRKPVIAAVHGHCIGGGIDLLCACDIRIASKDAVFSIRETRMAIIADLGTLQRLPHIIGDGWFRELALTGRDFSAKEALQTGFITRLCENREELEREAGNIALSIAENPPLAVQGVKEVILFSRDNGVYPGLKYVAQKNSAVLPSEDLIEAVGAFMEKRKPVFKGK